ncbi:cytochrome P450 [Cubamyces sp. BRFM 1775]|nr:cytochrome P450 [Cubamyces sp. BRFM 1775]
MLDFSFASSAWWFVAAIVIVYSLRWCLHPMHSVPTVGSSSWPILSHIGGRRFMQHSRQILQEGYTKYYGSVFKVAMPDQWAFVVSGPELVDQIRRWREDELSLAEFATKLRYTMGPKVAYDRYHIGILRNDLTHNVRAIFPDIMDELTLAIPECIPRNTEWTNVNVIEAIQKILARVSSRVFVGMPACRNPEYLEYAVSYVTEISNDRKLYRMFPSFMKPLVAILFSHSRKTLQKCLPILKPIIDERRAIMALADVNWENKPNDLLQWILDIAVPRKETDADVVARVMGINAASVLTSTTVATIALFTLAQNPEFVEPLRTEIESAIKTDGWTKDAFDRMWKLDSFLKELMRDNLFVAAMARVALKDITLRDGTVIPRGMLVMAAVDATHHDEAVFENADTFDPFRFARMREKDGEAHKHQLVHTTVDFVAFGHGRQACPGRFFVASELKAVLSYMLLHYDFKLSGEPWTPSFRGFDIVPPLGDLMFKKREVQALTRRGGISGVLASSY